MKGTREAGPLGWLIMESAVDVDLITAMTLADVAAEDAPRLGVITFIGLLLNSAVCSKPGCLIFNALGRSSLS